MPMLSKRKLITIASIACFCGIGYGVYHHHEVNEPNIKVTRLASAQHTSINHSQIPLFKKPVSKTNVPNSAKSALILDCKSGNVLYSKDPDTERKVASTAKLMTLYLVQHKANKIHGWNDNVIIPKNIAEMSHDSKDGLSSELPLKAGHKYSVKDLYQSALIESSDSASIALGEWVAGSNAKFVQLMNAQAKAWHLKSHFISASGLENDSIAKFGLKVSGGKHAGNSMSAMDLAIVTQHLLKEFPQVTKWSSLSSDKVAGSTVININANLSGQNWAVSGCDGLKTGFTPSAGYCYVGTRKQGNSHRVIVLLNDPNEFKDGKTLLTY